MLLSSRSRKLWLVCGAVALSIGVGVFFTARAVFRPPAASAAGEEASPHVSVDTPEWDFGKVRAEVNALSHTFKLSNTGSAPVTLKLLHLGCSCLNVSCPASLGPGASCSVRVDLELRAREGPFGTRVVLGTSDPSLPRLELRLRLDAQAPLALDPPFFLFTDVKRGEILKRDLRVIVRQGPGEKPPTIVVEPTVSAVRLELLDTKPATPLPGEAPRAIHRYRLRLDTGQLPSGQRFRLEDAVRVRQTGTAAGTSKTVPVEIVFRRHPFLTGPTSFAVQRSKAGREYRLRLRSLDGKVFTLTRVESTLPDLAARPAQTEAAKWQDVILSIKPGTEPDSAIRQGIIRVYGVQTSADPYEVDIVVLP